MPISRDLTDQIQKAWLEFIDQTEPMRPELYRYCRGLTGTVWDAEDLVQETLIRTFVRSAEVHDSIENARAYVFRVASNLWIDRFRGIREYASADSPEVQTPETPIPREVRDAASRLVSVLPPQERAAVLLKDVFDLTLEEIALALETSIGAVKALFTADEGDFRRAGKHWHRKRARRRVRALSCSTGSSRDSTRAIWREWWR